MEQSELAGIIEKFLRKESKGREIEDVLYWPTEDSIDVYVIWKECHLKREKDFTVFSIGC